MFHIGNTQILTPEIEVLQELKAQLALQGINLFNKLIETENHIQFNCPSHKGGQERKPSCGITKNDIIQDLGNGKRKVIEAGTVHCFQCGYTTSLPEMISDCFGKNDGGLFGIQWLSKNFITQSIETRKGFAKLYIKRCFKWHFVISPFKLSSGGIGRRYASESMGGGSNPQHDMKVS